MHTYEIVAVGCVFRVVETTPEGGQSIVSGFPTKSDAEEWLMNRLTAINVVDLVKWVRERAARYRS